MSNLNDSKWGRGVADTPEDTPSQSPKEPPKHENASGEGDPRPSSASGSPGSSNQPPDLDAIWENFKRKGAGFFGGLFGGGGRAGQTPPRSPYGASPHPSSRGNREPRGLGRMLFWGGGLLVLVWLATGFFVVQEGHQAVLTRFGRFIGTQGVGLNWRMPYPIESHTVVAVNELKKIEIGRGLRVSGASASSSGRGGGAVLDSSMLTQDENIVDVKFVVQYRLKSAADFVFNNQNTEKAIELAAEAAVREVVGKSSMNSVINEKRESIATDVAKSIQSQLDLYKTGVMIVSVNIQNVQPPEQVQAAFDDALKAGQDGDRAKNEGQAYANDIIPRAEGAAARLHEEAAGYKARVVAQAEGDAARFKSVLPEYQRAPQVMRDRLYLDAMQQVYSSTTKVLIDTRQQGQMLYLPLDKLLQATAGAAAMEAGAGTSASSSSSGSSSGVGPSISSPSSPSPEASPAGGARSRESPRSGRDAR